MSYIGQNSQPYNQANAPGTGSMPTPLAPQPQQPPGNIQDEWNRLHQPGTGSQPTPLAPPQTQTAQAGQPGYNPAQDNSSTAQWNQQNANGQIGAGGSWYDPRNSAGGGGDQWVNVNGANLRVPPGADPAQFAAQQGASNSAFSQQMNTQNSAQPNVQLPMLQQILGNQFGALGQSYFGGFGGAQDPNHGLNFGSSQFGNGQSPYGSGGGQFAMPQLMRILAGYGGSMA